MNIEREILEHKKKKRYLNIVFNDKEYYLIGFKKRTFIYAFFVSVNHIKKVLLKKEEVNKNFYIKGSTSKSFLRKELEKKA